MFQDAVRLALEAAPVFLPLRTLGFDIGLTPDGPRVVEMNTWWDVPYNLDARALVADLWRESPATARRCPSSHRRYAPNRSAGSVGRPRLRYLLGAPFRGSGSAAAPAAGQTAGIIPDAGIRWPVGSPGSLPLDPASAAERRLPVGERLGTSWGFASSPEGPVHRRRRLRELLQCAKDRGLNTQLIITDSPDWASGRSGVSNDPPTPVNLPAYAAFLSQLTAKLAPLVDVWTPWNEANFEMFWASPRDPVRYVQLQKAAYAAIKPADPMSRVSSSAVVGTPTSSGTNAWDYLEAAFAAGIKGSADLYLWNFYPRTAPEGTALDYKSRPAPWALSSGTYFRQLVDRYDPGKPVWITETSYATCTSPCSGAANQVTEAVQADYIARMFTYRRRYLDNAVERVFWYQTRDGGPDLHDWFQNQGIYRNDWTAKPAVSALAGVRVAGTTPVDTIPTPGTTGGGSVVTPVPTIPGPAAKPPAPAQGGTKSGIRVSLSKLKVATKAGKITIRVRANVSSGRARLRVEGYQGRRWRLVKALGGAARIGDRHHAVP
ncbi:MAG: hypothetical protein U0237_20720 [Thermoleophilia bacterium]